MKNIDIDKILNNWMDLRYEFYTKLEYKGSIYLHYNIGGHAEIRIDMKHEKMYYNLDLYDEFSEIIPLGHDEFEDYINKWAENIFGLKLYIPILSPFSMKMALIIPK